MSAGWGAALVVVARLAAVAWAGLGWHVVFPAGAARLVDCVSLRFVREGINTLLPVADRGRRFRRRTADVQARRPGRDGRRQHVRGPDDAGADAAPVHRHRLGLLVLIAGDGPIARTVAGGLAVAVPALGAFYLIQRRAGHRIIQA